MDKIAETDVCLCISCFFLKSANSRFAYYTTVMRCIVNTKYIRYTLKCIYSVYEVIFMYIHYLQRIFVSSTKIIDLDCEIWHEIHIEISDCFPKFVQDRPLYYNIKIVTMYSFAVARLLWHCHFESQLTQLNIFFLSPLLEIFILTDKFVISSLSSGLNCVLNSEKKPGSNRILQAFK